MRPIAFEHELFKGCGVFILAGAAPDAALDIILRHVFGARLIHGDAQAKIGFGIATAFTRSHDDFTRQPRKNRAALGIRCAFFAFDG